MSDLDFIEDKELRTTLENSIEFIYALYEKSKAAGQTALFLEETYRIIVLYVVAAIEAVLLYFFKVRGEKFVYTDYKCVHPLPTEFANTKKNGLPVVIAVQDKIEKPDHQIGLRDLVIFFKTRKLIQDKTAEDILELNELRNTFHFHKPRARACDLKGVESALQLLVHTIQRAPKSLQRNKQESNLQ